MKHLNRNGYAACGVAGKIELTDDLDEVQCEKCKHTRPDDQPDNIMNSMKDYKCNRCGGVISAGEMYYRGGGNGKKYFYHLGCAPCGRRYTSSHFESTLKLLRIRPMFGNESRHLSSVFASLKKKGMNIFRTRYNGRSIYYFGARSEIAFLMMMRKEEIGGYDMGVLFGLTPADVRRIQKEHDIYGFYPYSTGKKIR